MLKGVKPADPPVEQLTTFDVAINRATAKTLGISIPKTVLTAADEAIDEAGLTSVLGPFAICRLHRTMSASRDNPEVICSH